MDSSQVLILIGRDDCPLCAEMRATLDEVLPHQGVEVQERNVDEDPELKRVYGDEIPVLLLGDREVVRHRVTAEDLRRRLARMGLGSPT
jgi:glutaredoxin